MNENATLNKEQVLFATIDLLGDIEVPVRLKHQITDKIDGAIYNLNIVIAMIQKESEMKNEEDNAKNEETDDVNNLDFGGNEDDRPDDAAGRTDAGESTEKSGNRHDKTE